MSATDEALAAIWNELAQVLESVEWQGYFLDDDGNPCPCCPCCGRSPNGDLVSVLQDHMTKNEAITSSPHGPECRLDRALKKAGRR